MTASDPTVIGLVGGGWRAECYLRVAAARPDLFQVRRVLTRSASSSEKIKAKWGLSATTDLAGFSDSGAYHYVVVCVPRSCAPELATRFIASGTAVLAETPPAEDAAGLGELYKALGASAPVQVAEQYQFQPHHRARLEVVRTGMIGPVSAAYVSVAHGYHAMSLLRLALGVGFGPVTVTGSTSVDPVVGVLGREGWEPALSVRQSTRARATLQFEGGTGFYDFNGEQYFSPLRSRHIALHGTHGEVYDDTVNYIEDPGRPVCGRLLRAQSGADGDLDGAYLRSVCLGDRALYVNQFAPARLSDDELAVAECMARMRVFVEQGTPFYGLADACEDHYLSLLVDEATSRGARLSTSPQPWTGSLSIAQRPALGPKP
ncbi:MAG TPA: Gfo/Idh/MocA family oxidoreductase [Acidimicrobiales bacterium]|nr:Gfo/Idh/MocA family oxidoreductase [Acidimicrobiales bacterium]